MQIKKSHCRNTSPLPEKSFIVRNRRRQRGNEIIPQVTRLFPKPIFNALSLLDDLCVPSLKYTSLLYSIHMQPPTTNFICRKAQPLLAPGIAMLPSHSRFDKDCNFQWNMPLIIKVYKPSSPTFPLQVGQSLPTAIQIEMSVCRIH